MKKIVFLSILLLTGHVNLLAQKKKNNNSFFPVVVKFESVCCGVPSDAPLKTFLKKFKSDYKIKTITAYKYAPMGREGEYHLAFQLREMNREQRYYFKTKLAEVIPELKDKGKAAIELNMTIKKETLSTSTKINKLIF